VSAPAESRRPTRLPELSSTDRAALDALLDSTHVGHVGLVAQDGTPVVIPTAVVRDGDRVLMHGSTGSHWMRRVATGIPVALAVTAYDGLVVARSAFESSILYRSAVIFGACSTLAGEDKEHALDDVTEALLPGRVAEVRRPTKAELAGTLVLALGLDDWSLRVSDGWPEDGPDDLAGRSWAGVVPLDQVFGNPRPSPDLAYGIPVPPSVESLRRG
jgi:nitroimidazol reductase NimA-like FMN-containing flavoprotein (pyridoxamine 5'-phosphate oxidase superfamily)